MTRVTDAVFVQLFSVKQSLLCKLVC